MQLPISHPYILKIIKFKAHHPQLNYRVCTIVSLQINDGQKVGCSSVTP